MGCGKQCLKSINLVLATIFLLISIAEILLGTYALIYMHTVNRPETLGQQFKTLPSLTLILFGITIIPLIVLGCCGFCKEVACCVNLYSSIFLILSILQILVGAFAILTFTNSNEELRNQIKNDVMYSFKRYQIDPLVNTTQSHLQCCGVRSPTDWTNGLPKSCCWDLQVDCHFNSSSLNEHGCAQVLTTFVIFCNTMIGYISVAIGSIQILVAVLGFSLGCGSFRYYYKV